MTVKDRVARLNELNLTQEFDLLENLDPAEGEALGITEDSLVTEGLDPDEHRWYTTSITAFEVPGGWIGCRLVSMIKSENMGACDIQWRYRFYEMEQVMEPTYRQKQ